MNAFVNALSAYRDDVRPLAASTSSTEMSFYPAIRAVVAAALKELGLPSDVRVNTSERRSGGGMDAPDFALYDGEGDFVAVCGEVKTLRAELDEMARSVERHNQVGRYLALTRVVLLCNVRGFGLLTVESNYTRPGPVPPEHRRLGPIVELWPSTARLLAGDPVRPEAAEELLELLEVAVTRYAPIAEPETLARVLARQARRAKADLPGAFSQAVSSLADDFGKALGITFEGEEGEEFFRSSLVQTVFYGLFAGWALWARDIRREPFRWRDLGDYLRIPFLGELFHEIQSPNRIAELGLRPHLDLATETLGRVHLELFLQRLRLPQLSSRDDPREAVSAAILYFYEPFLETFDPVLRKELGVWYTPPEIVRYQVRRVEALLKTELACERGFADPRVVVLDPACGTGAYLIEVLLCMADTLRREGVGAELGDTLLEALRERVLGFEILTAPFVVAHLQLYLLLSALGAAPARDQRPGVFLTNALTGWEGGPQIDLHFSQLLEERQAAQARSPRIVGIHFTTGRRSPPASDSDDAGGGHLDYGPNLRGRAQRTIKRKAGGSGREPIPKTALQGHLPGPQDPASEGGNGARTMATRQRKTFGNLD